LSAVEQVESVRSKIHRLRDLTAHLADAHSRALAVDSAPSVGADGGAGSDRSALVVTLSHQASELAFEIRQQIVRLADRHKRRGTTTSTNGLENADDARGSGRARAEFEMRKVQLEALQKAFKGALEEVFRVEKEARVKTRERIERQYRIGEESGWHAGGWS
jgi:hypothetical protein